MIRPTGSLAFAHAIKRRGRKGYDYNRLERSDYVYLC